MRKVFLILLLLAFPVFAIAKTIYAQDVPQKSIVVFKTSTSPASWRTRIGTYHGTWHKDLNIIHAAAADLTQSQINSLKKDPNVLRIDPDVIVTAIAFRRPTPTPRPTTTPTPTPTPTPVASQVTPWGVAKIGAPSVWSSTTGAGVKVAVIDTGVDTTHPDLSLNVAGCVSFISGVPTCQDDNGHGTHVSGIIAAENNSLGVVGVAPNAQIYALKVLNSQGSGYLSDIISALNWAVTNKMQVVNMSLGTTSDVQSFHDAITAAQAAGVIEVAAAGNSGPGANTVLYPGAYPQVISVAATDSNNNVPNWSSRGPQVDIAAPGVNIYSTYLNNVYATLSGTSMATPHVTGTIALRETLHPGESFAKILSTLQSTATPIAGGSTEVGAGLVNVPAYIAAN